MPFGFKNALKPFQRAMNFILHPCERFVAGYIEVIIFSASWEEHIPHARLVLQALAMVELTAKPSKRYFRFRFLEYLGHVIGDWKVAVTQTVTALAEYKDLKLNKTPGHS